MGKTIMSTPKRTQRSSNLNSSPKKVPRATELQDAKVITRTSRGVKDRSIHAYELPFCNDGAGYGEGFQGKMGALHLEHNFPNVFFLFLSSLKEYCKFRNSTESTFPEKWQDLCSALNIKIATTSPESGSGFSEPIDEDKIGTFIKNRLAIYYNRKDLKNVCCFIDEYVAWRVTNKLRETDPEFDQNPKIVIHVQKETELSFESSDDMECEIEVVKDMDTTGVTVWQAHPPSWPPRFVIATVTSESENTITIVFSGNTKPFVDGFDSLNIAAKVSEVDTGTENGTGTQKEWFRCVRGIDLSNKERREWVLKIFGEGVLKGSPCVVKIDSFPKKDEDWNAFCNEISGLSNVELRT